MNKMISVVKGMRCNNPSCEAGNCVPACGCRCHEEVRAYNCGCVEVHNPQFWESNRVTEKCTYHEYKEGEAPSKPLADRGNEIVLSAIFAGGRLSLPPKMGGRFFD